MTHYRVAEVNVHVRDVVFTDAPVPAEREEETEETATESRKQ